MTGYSGLSIDQEIIVFSKAMKNTGNYREIMGITGKFDMVMKKHYIIMTLGGA